MIDQSLGDDFCLIQRNCSAQFALALPKGRVPPEVHRKLAIQAAESGISLNRIASSKLSQKDINGRMMEKSA
jgi:predicted HicB family RNase H-like nuclease